MGFVGVSHESEGLPGTTDQSNNNHKASLSEHRGKFYCLHLSLESVRDQMLESNPEEHLTRHVDDVFPITPETCQ